MYSIFMNHSLFELVSMLKDGSSVRAGEQDLFGSRVETYTQHQIEQDDLNFLSLYFSSNFSTNVLGEPLQTFYELSVNAFSDFFYAWMSELPVESEIVNFARKVIAAGDVCRGSKEEKRAAAERAACDRTDENTLAVLSAANKVWHEIHRMQGLLRFFPNEQGCYVAKCEPDHLILPALGDYFTTRFGDTPWSIIDEKRNLCTSCQGAEEARTYHMDKPLATMQGGDEWEDLWKHYHKTINNEDRKNPKLQRQFMPERYRKYLPEMGKFQF